MKYVKKKLEAKLSLRANKVPSCCFHYNRVKTIHTKRVRRTGKPLVTEPYIEETDDRKQEYRCQLKREQPFRSTSNDVCQATDGCNVDYQFLSCAPPRAPDASDASQLAPPSPKRRRLTKNAPGFIKQHAPSRAKGLKYLYGCDLAGVDSKMLLGFAAAFRKAYGMDFYITKYQGKMMESLTPLFQTMTSGIHRLEHQEKEEDEKRKLALAADEVREGHTAEPKKRRTQAELAAKARRVTVRLAAMANRCYWLSTTEVAVHIFTGGDALQTHHHQKLLTRQLQ